MKKSSTRTVDITILTERRYVNPDSKDPYIINVLQEELLVKQALERSGLRVERHSWDDPGVDWSQTAFILFRSTWDYFNRFGEFSKWLERVKSQTSMINTYETIRWNLDKHYLEELSGSGINIPPTLFIDQGETKTLTQAVGVTNWKEIILKPVISGAARHTYRFLPQEAKQYEVQYQSLIKEESMMIQEFQEHVPLQGEVAFMLFDGHFTHAILKQAKEGDFRVQDDFGGTVQTYRPTVGEINFAEEVVDRCGYDPLYARVDTIRDNRGKLALSELELIEPEMWFRFHPPAAEKLAETVINRYYKQKPC